jgi:hypothetical protein
LDLLAGTTFTTGTQTVTGNTFSLNSPYFSIKIGEDTAFFQNTDASITLTYTDASRVRALGSVTLRLLAQAALSRRRQRFRSSRVDWV